MQILFLAQHLLLRQEYIREVRLLLLFKTHAAVQLIEVQQAHHNVLESLQPHLEAIIAEHIKLQLVM